MGARRRERALLLVRSGGVRAAVAGEEWPELLGESPAGAEVATREEGWDHILKIKRIS